MRCSLPPSRALALAGLVLATACFERGGTAEREEPTRTAPAERPASPEDSQSGAAAHDPDASIAVRLEAEPAHLNPLLAGDSIAVRVTHGDVYEGLIELDPSGNAPRPLLAERVDVDDTGLVWTFSLRRGVRFHDGRALAAEDVLFSFGLLKSAPSLLAADLDDLEEIRIDGGAVVMRFAAFRMDRAGAIARVPILSRNAFAGVEPALIAAAPASRAPVGTGPFAFSSWSAGEEVVLVRNGAYWGESARAARLVYRILPSRAQTYAALADGTLDVAVQLPMVEATERAAKSDELGIRTIETPSYLAAVYNLRRKSLADPRARRALLMMLDRKGIVEEIFLGHAAIATGPFPAANPASAADVVAHEFSPAEAGKLLLSALGSKPTIRVAVPAGSRTMARVADIWAADAAPHASLEIETLPFADLLGRAREGKFDIALLAFTTGPDLDLYHRFHSSEVGRENYGALRDKVLDELLVAARTEPDREKRIEHQRAVHRRLHQLLPYAFIATDVRAALAKSSIGGVVAGPNGLVGRALYRKR